MVKPPRFDARVFVPRANPEPVVAHAGVPIRHRPWESVPVVRPPTTRQELVATAMEDLARTPLATVWVQGSHVSEGTFQDLLTYAQRLGFRGDEVNELLDRARRGLGTPEQLTAEMVGRAAFRARSWDLHQSVPRLPTGFRLPLMDVVKGNSRCTADEVLELQERVARGFMTLEAAVRELKQRLNARVTAELPLDRPGAELVKTRAGLLRNYQRAAAALGVDIAAIKNGEARILATPDDPAALASLKDVMWDELLFPHRAAVVYRQARDAGETRADAQRCADSVEEMPDLLPHILSDLELIKRAREYGRTSRQEWMGSVTPSPGEAFATHPDWPYAATLAAQSAQNEHALKPLLERAAEARELLREAQRLGVSPERFEHYAKLLQAGAGLRDVQLQLRSTFLPGELDERILGRGAEPITPPETAARLGPARAQQFDDLTRTWLWQLRHAPARERGLETQHLERAAGWIEGDARRGFGQPWAAHHELVAATLRRAVELTRQKLPRY